MEITMMRDPIIDAMIDNMMKDGNKPLCTRTKSQVNAARRKSNNRDVIAKRKKTQLITLFIDDACNEHKFDNDMLSTFDIEYDDVINFLECKKKMNLSRIERLKDDIAKIEKQREHIVKIFDV